MTQQFHFSNELQSAMPGVTITENFHGQVQFPGLELGEDTEDPVLLWLFRDGVECRIPPVSVSMAEWAAFEARCFQAAREAYENENPPVQHNAGFVPKASDLSYMEESDRFPETPSRQQ